VSAVSVFLIAVLILLVAVLVAFVIVMYLNTKRLARTVSEFQQEVQPIVEDITREADQASEHAAKLSEAIPGKEPGDKIRR
jgi:F0F1-type ATP synthase membrane subunit b/b'